MEKDVRRCDRYLICADVPFSGNASIRIIDRRDGHQLVGWEGKVADQLVRLLGLVTPGESANDSDQ